MQGQQPPRKTSSARGKRAPRRTSSGQGKWVVLWHPERTSSGQGKQAPRRTSSGQGKRVLLWHPERTSSGQGKRATRRTSNGQGKRAPRRTSNGQGKRAPRRTSSGQGKQALKETRAEVKDSKFAEVVQDMQEAIQRAQSANQRGRVASSDEFDILKEALNLQLGLAPAMSHALREKETKFLYALGDNDRYPHGDDIHSHAQRVFDDIKAEEESPETDVSSTSDGNIRSTGSPDQEEIIAKITNYVRLEATCDSSAKPIAPLVFLHAGGGTGKSWVAREIHATLRQMFGCSVVRFVVPSRIAASNLAKGSTIHHALSLAIFDGDSDTLQCKSNKAKLHRLRKLFQGCKVLIVDEVSMVSCRMIRDIHSRLCEIMQCQDKPFGGMCVVLMGNVVQLTPVGQTELFGSVKVQVGGQHLNDVFGRELLQKFDEVSLVKQHRATDPQYATSVSAFREWTASALQTRMEFVDTIVEITPEEFKDPTWQETPIVSTDQKTVHTVNEVMLQRFASARGLPIVAWRLPPGGSPGPGPLRRLPPTLEIGTEVLDHQGQRRPKANLLEPLGVKKWVFTLCTFTAAAGGGQLEGVGGLQTPTYMV